MANPVVVQRDGAGLPPRLRRLAIKAGQDPIPFLTETIRAHATLSDAARALSVSRNTLRNWMVLCQIVVE